MSELSSTKSWKALASIAMWVCLPLQLAASDSLLRHVREAGLCGGLCVVVGGGDEAASLIALHREGNYLIHRWDTGAARVERLRQAIQSQHAYGPISVERLTGDTFPYLDNLANLVVCHGDSGVSEQEALRVLVPGGTAVFCDSGADRLVSKPARPGTDEWTHPWHGPDGGLVTRERDIEPPTGLQWIAGPLFAMAGRKSSTQSVVSANGRNFYVTQNVAENIALAEKSQFLVARDAYNGLCLWQRPWAGPSVRGNGELNPRLAAMGDHVYLGVDGGLEILSAATGSVVGRIATPEPPTKFLVLNESLVVQLETSLLLFKSLGNARYQQAWHFREAPVAGTVATGQHVLALLARRRPDGNLVHDLICLRQRDGECVWRTDTSPWAKTRYRRILFAEDEFVGVIAHGHLHMFHLEDGSHLWSTTTEARPGKDYSDERYVGHFYQQGLVWMQLENSPRESGGQAIWKAFDARSGQEQRVLRTIGDWPRTAAPAKMGCQLMIASENYIMIPRQATFIELATGRKESFKFVRGGCGSGFVPAHGLLYSHPHACGCYTESMRGFLAVHSRGAHAAFDGERLEKGSEGVVKATPVSTEDWPMYRHDGARSGVASTSVPALLATDWKQQIISTERATCAEWRLRVGNGITAPVVAGGMVYVADVQGHQIVALEEDSGTPLWRFTAGSRIDTPPTIFEGRCLFGCRDGYVYCLNSHDGSLAWRLLVAPNQQRLVAHGQLESVWPVAGTVLVQDGVGFAAAGRVPDADGGMLVRAFDPHTGQLHWSSPADPQTVGLCDYMVGGRDFVYLAGAQFDAHTGACAIADERATHLRGGKAGLLEASWMKVDLALRKQIQDWTANDARGQLLAFTPKRSVGYRLSESGEGSLFAQGASTWEQRLDLPWQAQALVATPNHAVVGGARDRYRRQAGGFLRIHQIYDGELTAEISLPAPPVFDGIALARQHVYVALQNGCLVSLGKSIP